MALHFLASPQDQAAIGEEALTILSTVYSQRFPEHDLSVELSCASPEDIQALNRQYRQLDESTDVLSFPTFPSESAIREVPSAVPTLIGSIVICPEKAVAYTETLPQLVHHGLLHLLGYDHETDLPGWLAQEEQLLSVLSAHDLLIKGVAEWPS